MKDNSQPAFPFNAPTYKPSRGMTLRQWFAGMAMQGLLTSATFGSANEKRIAAWAWKQADAMLSHEAKEEE